MPFDVTVCEDICTTVKIFKGKNKRLTARAWSLLLWHEATLKKNGKQLELGEASPESVTSADLLMLRKLHAHNPQKCQPHVSCILH